MARELSFVSRWANSLGQNGSVQQLFGPTWLSLLLMGIGLFLVVMMAVAIGNDRGFLAMWRMQHDIVQLAYEVQAIELENRDLWHNIERLRSDMAYIERIAREELGLVRPGEIVFELVE